MFFVLTYLNLCQMHVLKRSFVMLPPKTASGALQPVGIEPGNPQKSTEMGSKRQARRPCDRVTELISDLAKRNQWERYLEKKGLR